MTVSNYTQIVGIFINIPTFYKFINKLIDEGLCCDKYLPELTTITCNFDVTKHKYFDEMDYEDDINTIKKSLIVENFLKKTNIFLRNKFVIKIAPHSYSNCANITGQHIILGFKIQYINNNPESDDEYGHISLNEPDIELIERYSTELKLLIFNYINDFKVKLFTVPDDCFCCS